MALDPDKSVTQYSVRIWNMQGGLPHNSVYAVRQTQDGYLWIGTQDGLVRFDGLNFELYTGKNTPQLKSNVIRALYEDFRGVLWIGTNSGGLTRYEDGEFSTYPVEKYKTLSKIRAIGQDRWGNHWIGSYTEGLTCLRDGKFTNYTTGQGLPHNEVRFISKDDNGDLWAATAEGIVKIVKPGIFQNFAPPGRLPYYKTSAIYDTDSENLWIGTGDGGLIRMKHREFTVYGIEAGLPNTTITYLYKDRMKNLWIGTDGGGLVRMKNGIFSALTGENGLDSGYVYSIYEDREGSLWLGTLDGGLHQLKDSKFTTYTTREGLAHDYIYSIHESLDGGLWIGTKQGLNRWKNGKVTTVLTARQGLSNNHVLAVYEDRAGHTWIGTIEGLHRLKDGKLTVLTKKDGLSDNVIISIFEDRQGNKWIGTENGLNRIDADTGAITVFTTKHGLSSNFIECIMEDSQGNLWIGTDAGLNYLRDGKITIFTAAARNGGKNFRCAYEDNQGTLWFGSDGGLIRLKQKETTLFTVQSGLVENYIHSILEDDSGYLWLGGRSGISRVGKKDLEDFASGKLPQVRPDGYNEKDGMKSGWCTDAGCKTRDGKLWFPTGKGVTTIDPNNIKPNPLAPSLIIEKLIADGETFTIKSTRELAPGKKRLEFYYTAVSFINPGKIRFKLKLVGYDSDWVDVGTARSTIYTGLSPGRYTFRVTACNPDGVWNQTGASFSFYLRPYFYQTHWFYFLVGLSALLVGFSLYRFRVRQLKARDLKEHAAKLESAHRKLRQTKEIIEEKNRQLEEQSQQLKELDEAKSVFFANISHEFRTPLTLIMGPLEQILSDNPGKEMQAKANLMLRNSRRLLNLINQLLELAKFESGKMQLEASLQDIGSFVKSIVMCFESLALQKKVALDFRESKQDIPAYFDPEKMEKIITNLLANAFHYTPEAGKITVSVRKVSSAADFPTGCVEISVRDTGAGIPEHQLPHIFDRFYRGKDSHESDRKGAGIGLALCKDLVELHHGDIQAKSSCRDDHTRGTEFIVRLPLGDGHLQPGEIAGIAIMEESDERSAAQRAVKSFDQTFLNVRPQEAIETAEAEKEEKPLVLVVEDNADVRTYIRSSFENHFEVFEAVDGKQGIHRAKEIIPDLIICDIIMPGIDGYGVCRTLKNDILTSHIPIILLTARVSEESVLQGLETGADDYITKPFSAAVLVARAMNLIDLRRQMQLERKNRLRFQPGEITVSPVDDEFYKELQDSVETHLSDPDFNVAALSQVLQMSSATLYRKIHALTGKTPNSFIRSYRLKRAAQLLAAHAGDISEVARSVGFLNKSYFTRCFKEQFHCSPPDIQSPETQVINNETFFGGARGAVFQKSPPGIKNQETILVVEDSEDARHYIRESLEPDYRVVEAADGSEGIARAKETLPDLIVSDIMMPEVDGYELCRVLKRDIRTSHIPIVLLTAKASEESIIQGLRTGADDYITKPFNAKILNVRIKNLMHLRSRLQENRDREMAMLPGKLSETAIDREFMNDLEAVMEENISDPGFNVERLADRLYMSRNTLYRKIIAIFGETPIEFIRSHRLRRGAQLLESNFGTVTEVAFEAGFSNSSYFTRCFKEVFHQLPSDYQAARAR